MSELTVIRTGYAPRTRRSPGALAAAIAVNGGVIALMLALPVVTSITPGEPPLVIHDVLIAPMPEEIEPVAQDPVIARHDPTPIAPLPEPFVAPKPDIPLVHDIVLTGTILPPRLPTNPDMDRAAVAHEPVFKSATQDPRYAEAFHPDYPAALRRAGLEGSVTVRVTISETGRVIAVTLVRASDEAFFRETQRQALRRWRFLPATRDGAPVQSEQMLTVHFRLND